jgi:3-isopropylmalate dehydrogenase
MDFKIGVFEGDFIGPEITKEAIKVLETVGEKFDHKFEFEKLLVSGEAYDLYECHLPQESLDKAAKCDALLKGPFGGPPEEANHPKWSGVEKEAILPLRKHFNLYTNLRPVEVLDSIADLSPVKREVIEGVDMLIVRELASGIYFGKKVKGDNKKEKVYSDLEEYSESDIERIAIKAFQYAGQRKKKVTLIAKSNVLVSSELWREVVERVHVDYKDIELDYMHVDNAAMQIILNPRQLVPQFTSNYG